MKIISEGARTTKGSDYIQERIIKQIAVESAVIRGAAIISKKCILLQKSTFASDEWASASRDDIEFVLPLN